MRYTAARDNVQESEEEIELRCLSWHALKRFLVSELLLDFEGMWQGDEWQNEPKRKFKAHYDKNNVRGEQQQGVEYMRRRATDKDCQCHDSNLLICFRIASIVAVQNCLSVECQWNGVIDQSPVDVSGL